MSAGPDSGAVAYCSPVAGLTTGCRAAIDRVDVLAVDEVLERLHASRSPCGVLASLRTRADLDLSDYGAQHELALRPSHATLGFQPANEPVETLRAHAIDDHRVVGRAGDVQGQFDLVALGEAGLELVPGRRLPGRLTSMTARTLRPRAAGSMLAR